MAELKRCGWVANTFEQYVQYHDNEWGTPVHDDAIHFEFLVLESAQSGLSWSTILKKREGYRDAFANFDVDVVAQFDEHKIESLCQNSAIIRNRKKIEAAINNARCFKQIQKEFGSFDSFIWSFVNHQTIIGNFINHTEAPATTAESDALARELKIRGFKFLGSTTIYAHMQALGLVNDHTVECFRFKQLINEIK